MFLYNINMYTYTCVHVHYVHVSKLMKFVTIILKAIMNRSTLFDSYLVVCFEKKFVEVIKNNKVV